MRIIFTYNNGQTFTARSPAGKQWGWNSKIGSNVFKYWVAGDRSTPQTKVDLSEVKKIKIIPTGSATGIVHNVKKNRIYSTEKVL